MKKAKRVLIMCAHSDDQVFGAGGYALKLAREKGKVLTLVSSYGENSHPHWNPDDIIKLRIEESEKANRLLQGHGVEFLGLKEGNFYKKAMENKKEIIARIKKFNPDRILTHASDDPHPDHRACHKYVLELHKRAKLPCEVYTFDVWTMFNIKKRRKPRLVIDITDTFKNKIDALEAFKSQTSSLVLLMWSVYTKALYWGWKRGCRYAEVYYKER